MSLDYTTYVNQIANLLVIGSTDANFITMLPGMIAYSEGRIYRELDMIATQVTDSGAVTASDRNFALPTNIGTYLVVDNVNIMTPVGTTAANGTRNPLVPVAREVIDTIYPSGQTATGVPQYFARANSSNVIFGPAPDAAYTAEVIGTQQPAPLSASNSSTILTQELPDLFVAASMVFGSAYQRDFSAQGDNPQMGQSWEGQYQALKQSADVVEFRKSFQSQAWTSQEPNPLATPPRA